jgi:hypothetical protein
VQEQALALARKALSLPQLHLFRPDTLAQAVVLLARQAAGLPPHPAFFTRYEVDAAGLVKCLPLLKSQVRPAPPFKEWNGWAGKMPGKFTQDEN